MNRPRSQLALTAVALILGLLVVLQIRSQTAGNDLASRSTEELTVLVANVNERNAQLRTEVAALVQETQTLQDARDRGESSIGELESDLQKLRGWAGLDPVIGPGIRVTVAGPVDGEGVMELINELRNAGAEAITIDDVRALASSVVAGPPNGLSVENLPLPDPFTIDAIGASETLVGSLTRAGGIVAQLTATYPGSAITVTPLTKISAPATTRDLRPTYSTPRL